MLSVTWTQPRSSGWLPSACCTCWPSAWTVDPHPCPSICGSQDPKESSLHLPRTPNFHPHFLKEVPQRLPTHIQVILTLGPGPLGPHPSNGLRGPVLHQFPHKEQCFYIPSYWLWADIRQLRARLGFREVFWDNRHAHIPSLREGQPP